MQDARARATRRRSIFRGIRGVHKCQHSDWKYGSIRSVMWSGIRGGPVPESRSDDGFALCSLALTSFPKYLRFNALSSRRSLYARTELISVRAIFAISPSIVGVRIQRIQRNTHTHTFGTDDWKRAISRGWAGRLLCARVLLLYCFYFFRFTFRALQNFSSICAGVRSSRQDARCWMLAGWRSAHASNKQTECLQRCNALCTAWKSSYAHQPNIRTTSYFKLHNLWFIHSHCWHSFRRALTMYAHYGLHLFLFPTSVHMVLFSLFHSFALIRRRTTKYFVGQHFNI